MSNPGKRVAIMECLERRGGEQGGPVIVRRVSRIICLEGGKAKRRPVV
jgi:hypothetical protein